MSSVFRYPSEDEIIGLLKNAHPEAFKFRDLDKAIVGVTGDGRLVYSENRILLVLQEDMGYDFEDALEQYENLSTGVERQMARRPPVVIVYEP